MKRTSEKKKTHKVMVFGKHKRAQNKGARQEFRKWVQRQKFMQA